MTSPGWSIVIPVKELTRAKSRLGALPSAHRRDLALDFARHTVGVACSTPTVASVLVVTTDPLVAKEARRLGAEVVDEGRVRGLNSALRMALASVHARRPDHPAAVLPADLPALSVNDLDAALRAALAHRRAVVPDADCAGTVLLAARRPELLHPAFGPGSCARHARRGHVVLAGEWPGLRRDVDTPEQLALIRPGSAAI